MALGTRVFKICTQHIHNDIYKSIHTYAGAKGTTLS